MTRQWLTIATLVALLVAIIVLKQRCATGIGELFRVIDSARVDGGARDR
jgi:hypothetical protein